MGQNQAKPADVSAAAPPHPESWLDARQQAALNVFCDSILVSREKLASVVPASLVEPLLKVASRGRPVDELAKVISGLLDEKREFEAVCKLLLDRPFPEDASSELRVTETCFECFVAMLKDDAAPISESERAEFAALPPEVRKSSSGVEVGRLLLFRCCDTGEQSLGSSKLLGSRVCRWMLQARLDPRSSWQPLYSSEHNGVGAAAFGRAVGCYLAPTVFLVRSAQGDVMGCYSEVEWRSGGRFFGNSRSRVFSLLEKEKVEVFEATGLSNNFCYFHLPSSKAQLAGTMPDGVAVGGQLGAFRLHVDADFKHGECSVFDSAFASGQLAPKSALLDPHNADVLQFEVQAVEVWGLGGQKAHAEKLVREQHEIKEAMKRRQVNRKIALGGDDEDGNVDMWLVETAGAHVSYVKEANHNDT